MGESLYDVLGVPDDASPAQVKAAFRKKAMSSHPDAGGDSEAFQRLKAAYDVLADDETRRHYDKTGETPDDQAATDAEEGRFRILLGDLLVTLISQAGAPEFTDILREVEEAIVLQIKAVDRQMVELSHLAARLAEVTRRLHGPEKEDLVSTLLQERLTEIEKKIKLTRGFKRRLTKLQEALGQYHYDFEDDNIL
ncbi:MAG TPA: DnaJ domain-containing protein [Magnetospirillaceae bacterium]|nr:DnaJ domain-containing protein [Magnetospirillaceae bacterium]